MTVQYASAAGTTWQVTTLSGTIEPGSYNLVGEAMGAGGTTSLPTPDATGSIPISATAGKIILCNTPVAQNGSDPATTYPLGPVIDTGTSIIDDNVVNTKSTDAIVKQQLIPVPFRNLHSSRATYLMDQAEYSGLQPSSGERV